MNNLELFEFIKNKACENNFNGSSNFEYLCCDISHSELTDLIIELIDGGDWLDDGKYSFSEGVYRVTSEKGHYFYIRCNQSRSGSYSSDYYYDSPELSIIEKDKYEKPIILYKFEYKDYVILCGHPYNSKDEYAAIEDVEDIVFNKVSDAIEYIDELLDIEYYNFKHKGN